MEPNAIYATRQGNLDGEKIEMSVDAASMAHVMSILTDLYSDPTMAVIREYSTNARDAMIEAGNGDKPIEVSLPNAMSPFFKVRDYGVGLSVEDIRNIYSKYGASTKRSTNEQVGMLGLGCKSALTYTQQFTVRSVKDGELVLVAISRTENGSGVMEVVHTSATDEENGVEISVPVNRTNDFHWKASEFFRFWEPGTVLVDGQKPKYFADEAMKISDSLYVTHNGGGNDYIVMGNVAYRVNSENSLFAPSSGYGYYGRSFGITAIVPIGSVNFTPSREDLHYTKKTLETISAIKVEAERDLLAAIQRELDAQENARDARVLAEKWNSTTRLMHKMKYNGKSIPVNEDLNHLRYSMNWGRGSVDVYRSINYAQCEKFIFVDGYEKTDISTAHRAKLRLWSEQNKHGNATFVVTKDKVDFTWFTPAASVSWEEVFKCRPERVKSKSDTVTYNVRTNDGYNYDRSVTELPKGKTVVLWTSGDREINEVISQIVKVSTDAVFLNLPKNRWDKYIRENPGTFLLKNYIDKMMLDALDSLSEDDVVCLTMHYDERGTLGILDPTRVDDPDLAKKIRNAKIRPSDDANKYLDIHNLCKRLRFDVSSLKKSENMVVKYPLIRNLNGLDVSIEHCYTYVNAVYNSNK